MKIQPIALLSAALFLAVPSVPAASYSIVRSFGVLTNVTGTVFKIKPDGTGFQVLMSFLAPVNFTNSTGANPQGGLVLSGSTLYGTASEGGSGGSGTVFKIGTNGTGFT